MDHSLTGERREPRETLCCQGTRKKNDYVLRPTLNCRSAERGEAVVVDVASCVKCSERDGS